MTISNCCQHAPEQPETCFIALGSNLGDPRSQVERALTAIDVHNDLFLQRRSSWYQSKAVGPIQPDYINGVIQISTPLCPEHLLDALQTIEVSQGRERLVHWGARTLDLDILTYGNQSIKTERLVVPHAFITDRNFVIIPMHEIAPNAALPDGTTIASLATQLGDANLTQIKP